MKILCITGNIAVGKSFVLQAFNFFGIPTFNSDAIIGQLIKNNKMVIKSILNLFPEVNVNLKIDRNKLADIVFKDKTSLAKLEKILYPNLNKEKEYFINKNFNNNKKLIALEIPLYFEKNYDKKYNYDYILNITSPFFLQKKRVLTRKNMTLKKFNNILNNQMSAVKKSSKSTSTINTGLNKAAIYKEVKKLIKGLIKNER